MSIDIQRILNELKKIPRQEQIMLQKVKGKDDNYGIGSLTAKDYPENEFNVLVYPELEYTNSIITDLNMCRTRVMRMLKKSCYSYHYDKTKRIHIPLVTNKNCFMVIEDEIFRYPADGNYYIVDTTKMHTFVNASFEERIHIVGCI
tara:strand:- start:2888 stop:3325 length:438 start_codon:yes stop_codon:yes gene_type:complete